MWENLKLRAMFMDSFVSVSREKTTFLDFSHDLRASASALAHS